ncbi:hypothetical protein E2C01_009929 [Portunus trituberculatus]|uniref:Uncharacterized protein n=1 Tax=Portunus trituberculatus TaxID=210409 RepID=A0A5B7D7A9_PORTR|nr:hypothetical protein [Portunus trituberculatus]
MTLPPRLAHPAGEWSLITQCKRLFPDQFSSSPFRPGARAGFSHAYSFGRRPYWWACVGSGECLYVDAEAVPCPCRGPALHTCRWRQDPALTQW